MNEWTEREVRSLAAAFVEDDDSRAQLAALARDHYRREGRGIIAISVRGERPEGRPHLREINIGYRPIEEYRRRTAPLLTGPSRKNIENSIQQIETYDPDTHVPIAVVCGPTFLTVTFLMRLDTPVLVEEAPGLH